MITNVSTKQRKRGAGYLDERNELIALSKLRRPDTVTLLHQTFFEDAFDTAVAGVVKGHGAVAGGFPRRVP